MIGFNNMGVKFSLSLSDNHFYTMKSLESVNKEKGGGLLLKQVEQRLHLKSKGTC